MADRRDILVNLLGQETVSAAAARAGRGLGRLGDDFDSTADDARGLDRQIKDVEQSLKDLSVMYARAGDAGQRIDITRALRQQEAELRRLSRARGQLGDQDEDGSAGRRIGRRLGGNIAEGLSSAGGPISSVLSKVFGTLPPQAQAAIGGGLIAAVGSVAPLIGGVLAGAVVGGVGIGGVVGGIAVAAQHPEVKSAAAATGKQFASTMERSAAAFVPATIDALGLVKSEIRSMEGDFEQIFAGASRWVRPLAESATGLVRNLLPGIQAVVDQGGPVIDELASWGPKLGTLLSDVFTDFAGEAENGASALAAFWTVMELGIRMTSSVIVGLTMVYGGMRVLSALLRNDIGSLMEMSAAEKAAKGSGEELAGGMQAIIDGFTKTDAAAAGAAVKVETLTEAIDRLTNDNISAEQAQSAMRDAIDRATEAANKGTDGINRNIPAQRANRDALVAIAEASNRTYDAVLKQTSSQEAATRAAQGGRDAFMRTAAAMNVSKAEAERLADMLFKIPNPKRTVTVETAAAMARAKAIRDVVNGIQSRNITIGVYYQSNGDLKLPGGTSKKGFAGGGPITGLPGPRGVDSGFIKAANDEHVITADEVAAAGGHGAIKQWRASLLGGRRSSGGVPAAAAAGGGGGQVVKHVHVLQWPNGQVAAQIVCEGFKASGNRALSGLVEGLVDAGGNPAVLGIGGRR